MATFKLSSIKTPLEPNRDIELINIGDPPKKSLSVNLLINRNGITPKLYEFFQPGGAQYVLGLRCENSSVSLLQNEGVSWMAENNDRNGKGRNKNNTAGTDTGEAVGTVGGGVAGAAAGSILGPVGTVAGGIAGAALGNQLGENAGGANNAKNASGAGSNNNGATNRTE